MKHRPFFADASASALLLGGRTSPLPFNSDFSMKRAKNTGIEDILERRREEK